MDNFLEAAKIVNTHGLNGELKIQLMCDSLDFLTDIGEIYIDGIKKRIISARPHKQCALIKLDGIENINDAEKLKNKIIYIDKSSVKLAPNAYFISDVIGFEVFDLRVGAVIGSLGDVLELPASNVYVIKGQKGEILIPAIPEFIKKVDHENRVLQVMTIEGMGEG